MSSNRSRIPSENMGGRGLEITNLHKAYGRSAVLQGIEFELQPGQISALLGPSGCGKSTLLNLVAGLDTPDQGTIAWDGANLAGVPAHLRSFGLMFQDYALYPHLNVFDNIAFGLRFAPPERRLRAPEALQQRVSEALELVGLQSFERRDVLSLSGGEQQRVALARSLAPRPRFLMLDEPLGALDHTLRERLIGELRSILRRLHQTALYVTHDQGEAFALADQVVLLNQGRVAQRGAPFEIYQHPASPFVASFLGMNNFLAGYAQGGTVDCALGSLPLPSPAHGPVTLLLRSDAFSLNSSPAAPAQPATTSSRLTLQGRVREVIFLGTSCRLSLGVKDIPFSFVLPASTGSLAVDSEVEISAPLANALLVYPGA